MDLQGTDFSDSKDPIFNPRDPNRVYKMLLKNPVKT